MTVDDAIEGFHVASMMNQLAGIGVLDALETPTAPSDVASAFGLDERLLTRCLEFLDGRTDLVESVDGGYRVTSSWNDHAAARLDQYVGAYGRQTTELISILRNPSRGPQLVDRRSHARALSAGAGPAAQVVADLIQQLDLAPTLDLGCGTGALLVHLAQRDTDFVGTGIDASPEMCAAAERRIAEAGVADRVTVVEADAFELDRRLLGDRSVRSLTACSVLDELWNPDDDRPSVADWLARAGSLFPGAALLVADYFGRLGHVPPPWPRAIALHDLVQALSGQGIPPPDRHGWLEAYDAAGVQVLHMVEDDPPTFFVHLLKLPT